MVSKKILIITTSADKFPGGDPTGLWLEELAAPYLAFKEAGYEIDLVSIKGGKIPIDPVSVQGGALTASAKKFQDDATLKKLIEETPSIKDVKSTDYDAVYLPGGHGVVFDVTYNEDVAATVAKLWAAGKVVSAVCHGPGGLVEVKTPEGEPIVKGKKVAGFADSEEIAVGRADQVPYLLESKLVELGGIYSKGDDWAPYAVTDGKLVTGQNPASSAKVAELVLKALA